ncbi:hypothetical protein LG943_05660 [Streptomonospora sp. S1-112]|uniref:Uncharacterized protein n=1 Tax=Streptomonospora mangrovi TaxID=2883123 RepID=A0A9X3SLX6_9ACTN|nr:hypothetical protein [Streptomonospora mangrovi]MDA0563816.1 hypothetical protein [Streptomonospora mangrovi]
MDAVAWQMAAVAAATALLLVADLVLRRLRSRAGAAPPSAEHVDGLVRARRGLDAVGLPLARQEAIAQSRVDLLAEAVRDAAEGRVLVPLADAARHISATDRRFAHAERSAAAAIEAKGHVDGG